MILIIGLILAVQITIIVGGLKMRKFESYRLAMTSSILLLLPCTFCWLGLPIGIWGLVVLCLRPVREAFTS